MKSIFYLLLLVSLAATSCTSALQPFTATDKNKLGLKEEQLRKVQFYLSGDITLQREVTEGSATEIEEGKITIVDGKEVEQIVIKRGTPGVLEYFPGDTRMGISFEVGEGRYLMFGINPDKDGKYYLLASKWKRDRYGKTGTVNYAKKEYRTSPQSAYAYLMVDMKKLRKFDLDRRQVEGRKIGD